MKIHKLWNVFLLAFIMTLTGCSQEEREDNHISDPDALIPVRVSIAGITNSHTPSTRAIVTPDRVNLRTPEGIAMTTTFAPATEAQTRTAMLTSVKYRVFVFDANDKCVQYKEIKAGEESNSSNQMSLKAGTYSFFAYSYNSSMKMPALPNAITSPVGLALSQFSFEVTPLNGKADYGGGDLLYAKELNVTITDVSTVTIVPLTFYHKFNHIELNGHYKRYFGGVAYFMDKGSRTTPFYKDGVSSITSDVTRFTGAISSYDSGTLVFDTSSTTAADTQVTPSGTVVADSLFLWSQTGLTIDNYGANFAYLPAGDITLSFKTATFAPSSGVTQYEVKDKSFTFSGKTVALGIAYNLDFTATENKSTEIIVAQGNLKYDSGSQTWSFYEHQYGYDGNDDIDLFEWDTLLPNTPYTNTSDTFDPNTDPCSQVEPKGTWRTMSAVVNMVQGAKLQASTSWNSPYNMYGWWFGSKSKSTILAAPDDYLFLPVYSAASSGGGSSYWTNSPRKDDLAYAEALSMGFNSSIIYSYNNRDGKLAIRCCTN